jgi:hypothetical protein
MSYHYLQGQAADCLELTYSDGGPLGMLNGTNIVSELSPPELQTASYPSPQSLQTCVSSWSPVPLNSIEDLQTWLQGVFPANHSALPGNEPEQTTSAICGPQHGMSSAWLDPDTASLKTFQACLIADISEPSLTTWPKAGIVCDGEYYPQPNWERRINEIGSGLWPTPNADMGDATEKLIPHRGHFIRPSGQKAHLRLTEAVRMWPTPNVADAHGGPGHSGRDGGLNLRTAVGGTLNPNWLEWLMGWPIGWAESKPLAMDKFRQWLEQHGNY